MRSAGLCPERGCFSVGISKVGRDTQTPWTAGRPSYWVLVICRCLFSNEGRSIPGHVRLLGNYSSSRSEILWKAEFGCSPYIGLKGVGIHLISIPLEGA